MRKGYLLIDHEEYKVKVKLSASTNFLLQQDMFRFGFVKNNEEPNINYFINHILPIIYRYRKTQDNSLEKKLSKICRQEVMYSLINELNSFYYEDTISYHNEIINLRISKKNMELFNHIFSDASYKKSTIIRSLINQYSNLKLDMREFLCFNAEYHLIEKALCKYNVTLMNNGKRTIFFPIEISTCPINSEIFVFGLCVDGHNLNVKAIRLCDVNIIQKNETNLIFHFTEEVKIKVDEYILNLEYLDNDNKKVGEI